ncbi:MAG: phage protein Gp36 family protein [Verrucomicrobiota bacterium]
MPGYITQQELTGVMPLEKIHDACSDQTSQQSPEEVWDSICATVSEEIDGLMAPRYAHPFPDPVHPALKTAARWITLEALYIRRGIYAEANPATAKADTARKSLRDIGSGKVLLDAVSPLPAAPAASIAPAAATEPMNTKPSCRRLLF